MAYEPIVACIVEFALIVTITFQTASTRMRQAIVDYNNPGSVRMMRRFTGSLDCSSLRGYIRATDGVGEAIVGCTSHSQSSC